MTTITTESIPSSTTRPDVRLWRSVAIFAAGALLATGLAAGIDLGGAEHEPTPAGSTPTVVSGAPSAAVAACSARPLTPC
jgi:hypothetical protein